MPRLLTLCVAGLLTVLLVRRDPRLRARSGTGLNALAAFVAEVRAAMTVRERELRLAAGLPIRPAA